MLGGFGVWELALVCMILLLLFGAKGLPGVVRGLGGGLRDFNNALRDE